MEIDNTTLNDLSIFSHVEEYSIFHKLDFTNTSGGKDFLANLIAKPLNNLQAITETQNTIKAFIDLGNIWPKTISNGTVMVINRFFEYNIEPLPGDPNTINSYFYKLFNSDDYSVVLFSLKHFSDFFKGMNILIGHLNKKDLPELISNHILKAKSLLDNTLVLELSTKPDKHKYTPFEVAKFGRFLKKRFSNKGRALLDIFYRLDAYFSLAKATNKFDLHFPEFSKEQNPEINADGLFHILLPEPISYDVTLSPGKNFLFLTGANMAGKSTFIKAIGAAVYLAHIGMAVPARKMQLSLFDGLLSNIQVMDNIVKGESYFFNEVQRIKNTILKINDGRNWLILIDELFKGTNIEDAKTCSLAVIKGLIKIRNSFFILSTHLYEIGKELENNSHIVFRYFETLINEEQLEFSYQLKEGISNDRLGYLILKREKVVDLLDNL